MSHDNDSKYPLLSSCLSNTLCGDHHSRYITIQLIVNVLEDLFIICVIYIDRGSKTNNFPIQLSQLLLRDALDQLGSIFFLVL